MQVVIAARRTEQVCTGLRVTHADTRVANVAEEQVSCLDLSPSRLQDGPFDAEAWRGASHPDAGAGIITECVCLPCRPA
jgi:hypothetical protein